MLAAMRRDPGINEALLLARQNRGHQGRYFDILFVGCGSRWSESCRSHIPIYKRSGLLLVLRQRKFSANWSRALILGTLVFATLNSSWAQDTGVVTTAKPNPLYPDASDPPTNKRRSRRDAVARCIGSFLYFIEQVDYKGHIQRVKSFRQS